jgi:sulfide:quinone oxidoreductase
VGRSVRVDGTTLAAEFLVVALGADFAPEVVPGLADGGSTFCTLPGAEAVRDALARFTGGRLVVLTAAPAYKCPAAPYEAAMLLDHALRRRGLRERTEIALYAAEPGPMGVAGPEVSAGVREMIAGKGIAYYPEHQVTAVDAAARRLRFTSGAEASYDLLVHVPPMRPPAVIRGAGLAAESGWVGVDRATLATRFEGVFAVGDVTSIPLELGKPLPKAGVFAHAEAEVVARNIARAVTGRGDHQVFDGHGECFVETGGGRAGFGAGDFYAEPLPRVTLHRPAWRWHLGKVLLEKSWLWRWF